MNSKFSFLSLLLLVLFSTQISYANNSTEALARKAVSENVAEAAPALEELRALGPAGLKALMDQYQPRYAATLPIHPPHQTSNGNASPQHSIPSLNKRTATSPASTGIQILRKQTKHLQPPTNQFSRCGF